MTISNTALIKPSYDERQLLTAVTRAPLVLVQLWLDGTATFAAQDGPQQLGIDVSGVLTEHYKNTFGACERIVDGLDKAFAGQIVYDLVVLNGRTWDIRLFPTYSRGRIAGVIALLTDASARLSSFRSLRTLDVLSSIRGFLAHTESIDSYLAHVVEMICHAYPVAFIQTAEGSGPGRRFTAPSPGPLGDAQVVHNGDSRQSGDIATIVLLSGREKYVRNIASAKECAAYHDEAARNGWVGVAALPLFHLGSTVAVLLVFTTEETGFDQEELTLLQLISGEVSDGITIIEERLKYRRLAFDRDVTERKLAKLVESVFDIVITTDGDRRIVDVNAAGLEPTGARDAKNLIGSPLETLVVPAHRDRLISAFDLSAHGTDCAQLVELQLLGLRGTESPVEGTIVAVGLGGDSERICVFRDIRMRKAHERAAAEAYENLSYAQQISGVGSIDYEVSTEVANWSDSACKLVLNSNQVGMGSFRQTFRDAVVDEDGERFDTLFSAAIEKGQKVDVELRLRSGEGRPRSVQLFAIPFHGDSPIDCTRVKRVAFVLQDVTAFRDVQRVAGVWEFAWDVINDRITWSPSIQVVVGFTSPYQCLTFEQLMGSINPRDTPYFRAAAEHTRNTGQPGEAEYEQRFSNGVVLSLVSRWEAVRDDRGVVVKVHGITQNVTSLRGVQKRIVSARRFHAHLQYPDDMVLADRIRYFCAMEQGGSLLAVKLGWYRALRLAIDDFGRFYSLVSDAVRSANRSADRPDLVAYVGDGTFVWLYAGEHSSEEAARRAEAIASAVLSSMEGVLHAFSGGIESRCARVDSAVDAHNQIEALIGQFAE